MLTAVKESGEFNFWIYKILETRPEHYLKLTVEEIKEELHRVYLGNKELTSSLTQGGDQFIFSRLGLQNTRQPAPNMPPRGPPPSSGSPPSSGFRPSQPVPYLPLL